MADKPKKYVEADEVAQDWGISISHAYRLIRIMNEKLREQHPEAIIIHGKVNRIYYRRCTLEEGDLEMPKEKGVCDSEAFHDS